MAHRRYLVYLGYLTNLCSSGSSSWNSNTSKIGAALEPWNSGKLTKRASINEVHERRTYYEEPLVFGHQEHAFYMITDELRKE